jgi:hypothetical protein
MSDAIYDELSAELADGGPDAALERLAAQLKAQGRCHELFDCRLMQGRRRLGLPLVTTAPIDDLPEPSRSQVEAAYLDACREVGGLLLATGRLREAWLYLRPLGEKAALAEALCAAEVTDANREELIELALHEGLAPRRGLEIVLANYGTCNAITMFDSALHQQPEAARRDAAALMVRHLHAELTRNLRAEIARHEGRPPEEPALRALVADRDWLFADNNYHVDTSHLHAVVRFARYVTDPEVLRLALDLTDYGRRLSPQYHFPGEEPFVDAHATHGLFFAAQLGERVEEAIAHFKARAEALEASRAGTYPAEVYLALLARLGRDREALEALPRLLPPGMRMVGFAPHLLELARRAGAYQRMRDICRQRGDLLGYAAALVEGAAPQGATCDP